MYHGITISDLLKKLKITKQSLNRVLKDLLKNESIFFEKSKRDNRLKRIYLTNSGQKLFNEIFSVQKKRIYKALLNSTSKEVLCFNNVIKKIINEKI
jgi:DNA-binding MarR family transcriptional regulator